MKLFEVSNFCKVFCRRFSVLDLKPFQLEYSHSSNMVSIALTRKNETAGIEAVVDVDVNTNTIRLLKINCFENIDTFFPFDTPLELYTNLLTLLLLCCHVSGAIISPSYAVSITLGREIKTWRELVTFICSLSPKEQGTITVHENHQNAIRFLRTTFHVTDGMLITDGLHKSQTPFKDQLELVRAVLDGVSAVFKIYGYSVDPFSVCQEQ